MSTYREGWRSRNVAAWVLAAAIFGFYLYLYLVPWQVQRFTGEKPTDHLENLAQSIFGALGTGLLLPDGYNKWYLYGFLYGVAMTAGAFYYLRRHGNSRYNKIRIGVNLAVQWLIAFLLPYYMVVLTGKDYYFSYLWPLKIEYFYPGTILDYPLLVVLYSFVGSLVMVPLLVFFFGKRWYCSWICGCGALANTAGDPWRHLSDKRTGAWKFEQFAIHGVLLIALVATVLVGLDFVIGDDHAAFSAVAGKVKFWYGLIIGAMLQGVVGVGFYPILGPRVWCRFFCPMAAVLGMLQKIGRFRITVKNDMCISCGNCSAYCEMGIDVRSYAQANQDFTRAACVGCGMCAHVCPRGVLKLENVLQRSRDKQRQKLSVVDF